MRVIQMMAIATLLMGCDQVTVTTGDSISSSDLESLFRKHKIDGNHAVALKKRSAGVSYLVTIHGYPNNLSVCEELIAPYNEDLSLSVLSGEYFCEELR